MLTLSLKYHGHPSCFPPLRPILLKARIQLAPSQFFFSSYSHARCAQHVHSAVHSGASSSRHSRSQCGAHSLESHFMLTRPQESHKYVYPSARRVQASDVLTMSQPCHCTGFLCEYTVSHIPVLIGVLIRACSIPGPIEVSDDVSPRRHSHQPPSHNVSVHRSSTPMPTRRSRTPLRSSFPSSVTASA